MRSCDILPILSAETYEICEVQKHAVKCLKSQEVFNTMFKECMKDTQALYLTRLLANDESVIVDEHNNKS